MITMVEGGSGEPLSHLLYRQSASADFLARLGRPPQPRLPFPLPLSHPGKGKQKHCKEISIYVFPEKELCGLSSNFHHIHVSVSDLYVYIPTFGPPVFLQQNRQTDQRNI